MDAIPSGHCKATIWSPPNQLPHPKPDHHRPQPHTHLRQHVRRPRNVRPSLNSLIVSIPNAENVVNPPRTPISRKACTSSLSGLCASAYPTINPIRKHPTAFTARVPYGNPDPPATPFTPITTRYRATAPTTPPTPTHTINKPDPLYLSPRSPTAISGLSLLAQRSIARKSRSKVDLISPDAAPEDVVCIPVARWHVRGSGSAKQDVHIVETPGKN